MSTTQACELDRIFEEQLQIMAATLRPATITYYRAQANRFLRYLHQNHPELHTPAQLQRNPHILGWLRSLSETIHPLPTGPALPPSSAPEGCYTIWPTTDIP